MMSIESRHVDKGKFLSAFADEILVNCSACGAHAVVIASWAPYVWRASFACCRCALKLDSALGDWVGPVRLTGRQPCGYCGFKWLAPTIEYPTKPDPLPTQVATPCPQCSETRLVNVSLSRRLPVDRCCDPHFGLPLRLAINTRHGVVWAYNPRHLHELLAYISAKIRVRQFTSNRSMFSRLPRWMKLAKHREEIIKALEAMRAKI